MVQIERADELSPDLFNGCTVAGLTAGASTPAGIIKEVYATMSEEIKAAEGKEESFEELLNQSFKTLNNGDRVTGIVTAITPTEVQVDVGAKQAAYIKLSELSDDPNVKAEEMCIRDSPTVEQVLQKLMDYYAYERRGIRLLRMEDTWQLCSAPDYADVIRKAFEIRKPAKLSQPALEVLTIIAYYQPVSYTHLGRWPSWDQRPRRRRPRQWR